MISSETIVSSQGQSARQKADQVILQEKTTAEAKLAQQREGCVQLSLCFPAQLPLLPSFSSSKLLPGTKQLRITF